MFTAVIEFADSSIIINPLEIKQPIRGFGASDAWLSGLIHQMPTTNQTAVLDALFSPVKGAGLSMLRHRVEAYASTGPGQYNWDLDWDSIWLTGEARARGVSTVWCTPWTPPKWMKSNNDYANGGQLLPEHYQDYADFLATYVSEYKRRFNITIDALSLQNEPDINATYESCLWSGEQLRDFLKFNIGPTFRARGLTTKLILPEYSGWNDYLSYPTLQDTNASQFLSVVATHSYGGDIYPFTSAMSQNKDVWETEVSDLSGNDPSINDALRWASMIHDSMVTGNANAWHYWWLVTGWSDGQSLIQINSDGSYQIYKRLWALGNFSRFVRPGFIRVNTSSSNPESGVLVSAYTKPGSGNTVLVVVNQNYNATNLAANIGGVKFTSVRAYRTSNQEDLAQITAPNVVQNTVTIPVAARSITTIVTQPITGSR